MALAQTLRLRPGATLDEGDEPALVQGMARVPLRTVGAETLAALRALAGDGLDAGSLVTDPQLALLVNRLESGGWLSRTLLAGDRALVTREPLAFADVLSRRGVDPAVPVKLSRFALLHHDADGAVLESGAARARAIVHEARLAGLAVLLGQPRTVDELDAHELGVEPGELTAVLRLLVQARLVVRLDDQRDPEEEQTPAQWSPIDLLFHSRSRLGRRGGGYGGTYPFKERFPEPPAIRPDDGGERIALPRPDLEALAASDISLTQALERRRSIREHDDANPIDLAQLGELLFRTSRVRHTIESEEHGSFALRPYPNGGALYELEVYPVVRHCAGLEPGLYRYDPVAHALQLVREADAYVDGLIEHARVAALLEDRPQVLLTIAARFGRVSWKYEAVAYALTLKHVGVLYQTLYLAATAMGLAPCGLGGGDSDLFARAAGLDFEAETSVGELIVGSRPSDSTGPGIEEVAAPAPQY